VRTADDLAERHRADSASVVPTPRTKGNGHDGGGTDTRVLDHAVTVVARPDAATTAGVLWWRWFSEEESREFTFRQLSAGLRIILICIFFGSCAGASNNSVTDSGFNTGDVQQLQNEVTTLSKEVRQLRRELRRQH
jgi:hypothetical protein